MTMDEIQQAVTSATVIVGTAVVRLTQEGIPLSHERIEAMAKDCVTSLLNKFIVSLH